jgi:hypothetical protein
LAKLRRTTERIRKIAIAIADSLHRSTSTVL